MIKEYKADREYAQQQDNKDPLKAFRNEFFFPQHKGSDAIYFCGNSLGLQPKGVQAAIEQELKDWRELAVLGYSKARNPWLFYQDLFSKPLSAIAGCLEEEVTVMNTLTVNLHALMASFYKPDKKRFQILMEAGAFPSDQYAIASQVALHDLDPKLAVLEIGPRPGEKTIRDEDIISLIKKHADSISVVLLGGINYYSGQLFDMAAITEAAHAAGAIAGFDLAHAIGNSQLALHDWEVDFAVWCSYKYLNGGPGAVGAAFIHQKHTRSAINRMAGWWGNDEKTRFLMEKQFVPKLNASGWNASTAQVFNMVSLKASLELFGKAGMENILIKSRKLTAYLEYLLSQVKNLSFSIITPSDPEKRGSQLSLYFHSQGREIHEKMIEAGIIVDYREPGVIRIAPAPLYNSFQDVFAFYSILKEI